MTKEHLQEMKDAAETSRIAAFLSEACEEIERLEAAYHEKDKALEQLSRRPPE